MTTHQEVQSNLHFLLPGLLAEEIAEIREVQPQASLGVRRKGGGSLQVLYWLVTTVVSFL